MIVEYERTLEDLVEFNLFHIAHSPSLQRQILLTRVFISLLIFFLTLGASYLLAGTLKPLAYISSISIIGSAIFFVIYPSINRSSCIRRTRKLLSEDDNNAILGRQIITASSEGLFCETDAGESKLNWSSIAKVVQNDDYIFLYIGAVNAIIIPKNIFSTDQEQQKFLDFIHTNCKQPDEVN